MASLNAAAVGDNNTTKKYHYHYTNFTVTPPVINLSTTLPPSTVNLSDDEPLLLGCRKNKTALPTRRRTAAKQPPPYLDASQRTEPNHNKNDYNTQYSSTLGDIKYQPVTLPNPNQGSKSTVFNNNNVGWTTENELGNKPKPNPRCPVCGERYLEETPLMLQCESCHIWVHSRCVGIDQTRYRRLQGPQGDPYKLFCPECLRGNELRQQQTSQLLTFAEAYKTKANTYLQLTRNRKESNSRKCQGGSRTSTSNDESSSSPSSRTHASTEDNANTEERSTGSGSNTGISGKRCQAHSKDVLLVKPPDAYMLFKYALMAANPDLDRHSATQSVALKEWLCMTKGEKRRFFSEADRLMTRYRINVMADKQERELPRRKRTRTQDA